jgi:hypothetical protein
MPLLEPIERDGSNGIKLLKTPSGNTLQTPRREDNGSNGSKICVDTPFDKMVEKENLLLAAPFGGKENGSNCS